MREKRKCKYTQNVFETDLILITQTTSAGIRCSLGMLYESKCVCHTGNQNTTEARECQNVAKIKNDIKNQSLILKVTTKQKHV